MEFLVKAREYGTVVIELEGVNELNPETAVQVPRILQSTKRAMSPGVG